MNGPTGQVVSCPREFAASPLQSLPAVRKRVHLDGPAILDCVHVCEFYVLPLATVFGTDVSMNENDDAAADRNKLFWFTGSLG